MTSPARPARLLALLLALSFAALPAPPRAAQAAGVITVSAAASLEEALMAIKAAFEAEHPGLRVDLNLGSSGALGQQIQRGAPVDVFLSASEEPMQALVELGLVAPGDVRVFATGRLVLVGGRYTPATLAYWEDLSHAGIRRVALGNPEHVPAGQYGQAVLESLGLWEQIRDKLVFGEDVRQVLAYVESGGADAGLVYSTDAAAAPRVRIIAHAPAGTHPPIRYLGAVVGGSKARAEARAFMEFMLSAEGRAVLREHGFGSPEGASYDP